MQREWLGEIGEGTSKLLVFEVRNEAGEATQPLTLVLTLYDDVSKELLGGRTALQDILNANGGTATAGAVTLELTPADNTLATDVEAEDHVAFLQWTYQVAGGGTRTGRKEYAFRVTRYGTP
jgi:hypothetical protein